MRILTELEDFEQISYMRRWLRVIIAIFFGITMVYISEPDAWASLHRYKGFTLAISVSCAIAIGLSEIINFISCQLDKRVSWLLQPGLRFWLQLGLGVILPISFAVLAIWRYFTAYGLALTETTYFERVLYPTCLLIIFANAYYPVHLFIQLNSLVAKQKKKEHLQQQAIIEMERANEQQRRAAVEVASKALNLSGFYQIQDIAIIFTAHRKLWWYSTAHEKLQLATTLEKAVALLHPHDFCQVSRSCIVARSNIVQAYHYSSKLIELQLHIPEGLYITVAQRTSKNFKDWYGLDILPKRKLS